MSEEAELAPEGAGGDAATPESATQIVASEATENTEGQPTEAPAEADQAEEEEAARRSRNDRRREQKERIARELHEARVQAERAAQEAEELRKTLQKVPAPREADFSSFEEYQAALVSHATITAMDKRRLSELEASAQARFTALKSARDKEQAEVAQNWATQQAEGRAKYPDFDTVALTEAPIKTEQAALLVAASDHAADVAYILGKDKVIAAQFEAMQQAGDVVGMARIIGRLEAQAMAPKTPKITNAPPPITPVKPTAATTKDPLKMTASEYDAWRSAGGTF